MHVTTTRRSLTYKPKKYRHTSKEPKVTSSNNNNGRYHSNNESRSRSADEHRSSRISNSSNDRHHGRHHRHSNSQNNSQSNGNANNGHIPTEGEVRTEKIFVSICFCNMHSVQFKEFLPTRIFCVSI